VCSHPCVWHSRRHKSVSANTKPLPLMSLHCTCLACLKSLRGVFTCVKMEPVCLGCQLPAEALPASVLDDASQERSVLNRFPGASLSGSLACCRSNFLPVTVMVIGRNQLQQRCCCGGQGLEASCESNCPQRLTIFVALYLRLFELSELLVSTTSSSYSADLHERPGNNPRVGF